MNIIFFSIVLGAIVVYFVIRNRHTKQSSDSEDESPKPKPVYPTCAPHKGSVWALCGDEPIHRWGVGPDGQEAAIGNCNYSVRRTKGGGACTEDDGNVCIM